MGVTGALLKPSEKGERRPTASRSIAKGSRYEVLKDTVRNWLDDRVKVGDALREIQSEKLYQKEYATFEDFCEEEFGLKVRQAYRLIETAEIKESLCQVGHKKINESGTLDPNFSTIVEKLVNPAQAHALAAVPEEKRVEVLTEAAKAPGPLTAKRISEAAKAPKIVEAVRLDKTGYPIPAQVIEDWDRAEAFHSNLRELSRIKSEISKGLDDKDVIFREINSTALSMLKNLYGELKCVVPYAVCSSCQGRVRDKCALCKGRGFLSDFAWTQFTSPEVKEMRKKLGQKK